MFVIGVVSNNFGQGLYLDNGAYDVTVNGLISATLPISYIDHGIAGIGILENSGAVSRIRVGATGRVICTDGAIITNHATDIDNAGTIIGHTGLDILNNRFKDFFKEFIVGTRCE